MLRRRFLKALSSVVPAGLLAGTKAEAEPDSSRRCDICGAAAAFVVEVADVHHTGWLVIQPQNHHYRCQDHCRLLIVREPDGEAWIARPRGAPCSKCDSCSCRCNERYRIV